MKKQFIMIGLIVFLWCGILFSGCVQTNPSLEKTDADRAVDIVSLLQEKDYTGVYGYFNGSITSQVTPEQFEMIWEQQVIATNGNITSIGARRLTNESGYQNVYVTCTFSKLDKMDIRIIFNSQHLVISLTVVPTPISYTPPSYVNLSTFTEESVLVGAGEWVLPGNLTIPNGVGPFPAVVLVQGSGPNDQDETVGSNKPFKDISWGLASQGVVVLRYVKRTHVYPQKVLAIINFTVDDEVIDDVIAAIDLLNESPMVNQSEIFVLGHSLGGYLAPRIASQDRRIAGLMILAGPTRPLEDLLLEQTYYLTNLSGVNASAEFVGLQENVTKIKTLNFTNDEVILNAPASYWRDLASYDPVATAQTVRIPMLILQGLRDYQVTQEDFTRWNETFRTNTNVTMKTYPLLNHLFIAGTGVPTNKEYLTPGHVAEEVINDLAVWIQTP